MASQNMKKQGTTVTFDEAEKADFEEAFELFDKDGDGTISTTELKNLLRCFGKKATDQDVQNILERHHKCGEHEEIDFNEFKNIMADIMAEPEFDEEIHQVYKVFDRDEKGVDHHSLMEVMNKLLKLKHQHDLDQQRQNENESMTNSGKEDDKLDEKPPQITAEEALDIIKEYDLDGDERLNFDEF